MKAPIRRGDVVFAVGDPRRHGIVNRLHLKGGFFAAVRWLDTAWRTDRVPVADLRLVSDEPSSWARPVSTVKASRRHTHPAFAPHTGEPKYAYDDGLAIRFALAPHYEAWAIYKRHRRGLAPVYGEWFEYDLTDAVCKAGVLSKADFERLYGDAPPLPDAAFRSGWSSPLV